MMSDFATRLIAWQRLHGRNTLPWKGADAYRVWLSEIMLQQTQVVTVIPYYQRFVASFPDVAMLAAASEEQVLAHWSGLGYYARGRNLHRAAQLILQRHDGKFPCNFDDIIVLPGIGRSTAAAISALAFHQRRPILDGNVKRVLARYCAIEGYAGDKGIEEKLWQQAEALLPEYDVASYTQGLMDLGATICTRTKPHCDACPLQQDCAAYQGGRIAQLPTPRPKKVLPEKHSTFLLLINGSDILLEKRPSSGIWGGLLCTPQFDDEQSALAWCMQRGIEFVRPDALRRYSGQASAGSAQGAHGESKGHGLKTRSGSIPHQERGKYSCEALPVLTHTFTHFRLYITPLVAQATQKPRQIQEPGSIWLAMEDALQAAIPTPVRTLLQKIQAQRTPI